MSSFDRICPITGKHKGAFDQVLTSWFLDAAARKILSKHFLCTASLPLLQAKLTPGFLEHEDSLYLPVYYKGKIPPPSCQEVFLSFRKIDNPKWRYGYVLIRAKENPPALPVFPLA